MGASIGTVAGIWRYPVKSMQGEALDASAGDERGLAGDRGWAVVDAETGKVASAKRPKRWLTLLECAAEYVAEPEPNGSPAPVRITLPSGRELESDDPECEAQLSEAIGRPVKLMSSAPEGATYDVREADAQGLTAETPEAMTEAAVGMLAPAGTFFDTATLHVLTGSALSHLAEVHPGGRWDVRRFRPNVLVDLDAAPADEFPENAWIGRSLHLGEDAQAAVLAPMPRCVMTTLPQGDLDRDPLILRTLAQQNRREIEGYGTFACVGVLANLTTPGDLRVGDRVALGDPL